MVIGNVIFYVQHFSSKVCSLAYSDTIYGYDGIDVSVMSAHLFDGHTIVDWAYQQEPWSILWGVRDDGVILAFTFLKEHQVQAWSKGASSQGTVRRNHLRSSRVRRRTTCGSSRSGR